MVGGMNKSLAQWLHYIEGLHPKSIEMGLERINRMIACLDLKPDFKVISVAGTNGKGSTCAILESIYINAGYEVGCYSSPHFLKYNERVRINQVDVRDALFCQAFSVIEKTRIAQNIQLTYFEFGTLAAVWCLMQHNIDVAILEIGLGGRLDAVNAFEPNCAIVTNVALDHQDYLGDTRELIGREKAGVYRQNAAAICGDANPPVSLVEHARNVGVTLQCIGTDFVMQPVDGGVEYLLNNKVGEAQHYILPALSLVGEFQMHNAACAITAIESLQAELPVNFDAISKGVANVKVAGRFEEVIVVDDKGVGNTVIYDVAHNPHAAQALATSLAHMKSQAKSSSGKVVAVFSMLADKDIEGVVDAVKPYIDQWFVGEIQHGRAASVTQIGAVLQAHVAPDIVNICNDMPSAFNAAINQVQSCEVGSDDDKILVFGSFFTVACVKRSLMEAQS